MSRTDKTRPYHVKKDEALNADPYGHRREAFVDWRAGLRGCGTPGCYMCGGWRHEENRRERRRGKRSCRDHDLE